jgi:hypothetical protein
VRDGKLIAFHGLYAWATKKISSDPSHKFPDGCEVFDEVARRIAELEKELEAKG